jgi:hypothetical protein
MHYFEMKLKELCNPDPKKRATCGRWWLGSWQSLGISFHLKKYFVVKSSGIMWYIKVVMEL